MGGMDLRTPADLEAAPAGLAAPVKLQVPEPIG